MALVLPAERDLRRVIGDGEDVPDGEVEGLSEADLLELHRQLVLLRTYDERSVVYHRQGRIGTYAIFWGHEAMQVGSSFALERADWIFPSYRESAIGLLRGMPAATILSWWRGHPSGWWNPADWNVASICVPIATHVPHAAGLAWGKKLRGETTCAIAYFGDGATSEGAFHEGANFAAVMRAPVVLFCNNNQWAISTPLSAQTAAETLADKAVGYGIPGVRVDGGDVLAVYEATREAVDAGARGRGPDPDRGRHLPRRASRDRGRPEPPTSTRSGSRRNVAASASAATRRTCAGSGCSRTRPPRPCAPRRRSCCATGSPPPRPSLRPTRRSSSRTPTSTRRRRSRPTSPS